MKRYSILLLCVAVLCTAVGCGTANAVTPASSASQPESAQEESTVISSQTESDVASSQASSVLNVPESGNKSLASSAVATTAKPKSESKVPVSSSQQSVAASKNNAMPALDTVFHSEAELKTWLRSGSTQQQERTNLLQVMTTGNTVQYLRPNIAANDNFLTLKRIEAFSKRNSYIMYEYNVTDNPPEYGLCDLSIYCHLNKEKNRFFDETKENYKKGVENYYSKTVNNVEYVYFINQKGIVSIDWIQQGIEHSATLRNNHADLIDQILPLLNLQKVTYRTDVVEQ